MVQTDALSGRSIVQEYWHHRSFPTGDSKKKRLPISSKNVQLLKDAVLPTSRSIYSRKRRYVMLLLLEITGARRFEIASLTVQSVLNAAKMPHPMLKLITAKKKNKAEEHREIPILRQDLEVLLEFIDKNRKIVVRKSCGLGNDDGILLASEKSGRGIQPNTITQEVYALRKYAQIKEKACAHMFRHAFVTKLFKALIERHKVENKDDFRQMLLDGESLKREIQQWTGHTRIESLEAYIHLAFEDSGECNKAIDAVKLNRLILSLKENLSSLKDEMILLNKEQAIAKIDKLLGSALTDLRHIGSGS